MAQVVVVIEIFIAQRHTSSPILEEIQDLAETRKPFAFSEWLKGQTIYRPSEESFERLYMQSQIKSRSNSKTERSNPDFYN